MDLPRCSSSSRWKDLQKSKLESNNHYNHVKSKWTWMIFYTKLLSLVLIIMYIPQTECQKQCKQPAKDEVIRWNTNSSSHVVEWRLDFVCTTEKECYGFSSSSNNGQIPVQLCPFSMQEGNQIFIKSPPPSNPYPVRVANVSHSDWLLCPNSTHPLDQRIAYDPNTSVSAVPARFLTPGTHNLAQMPNGVFSNCRYGLRLKLTIKSKDCQPNATVTSLCFNHGTCGATIMDSLYTCHCDSAYVGRYCTEYNACHSSPCKNGAACTDVVGPNPRGYTCNCTAGFRGKYSLLSTHFTCVRCYTYIRGKKI